MKVNEHIVNHPLEKSKCLRVRTCPECGSTSWIEHLEVKYESLSEDDEPINEPYYWYCLDCGHRDYDYLPF